MQNNIKESPSVQMSAFGCVTPIGSTYQEILHNLSSGTSGIKENYKYDCSNFVTKHAGIPDEGNEKIRWPSKKRVPVGEFFYAELAAQRLKKHPLFPKNYYSEARIGCIVGVDEPAVDMQLCCEAYFKSQEANRPAKDLLEETFRVNDLLNLSAAQILSVIHKKIPFSGVSMCHLGLCSASLQAIGIGFKAIQSGQVDTVIVGGASGKVNPLNHARLELIGAISVDVNKDPITRSRPFDIKRSGFVLGEGAIFFLLEKSTALEERGQQGVLEILGYGSSLSGQHIITPHTQSLEMKLAMERAINDAGVELSEIDLINAHGTSTQLNDLHESMAINMVFKEQAKDILVTANKSLHGHLIAAAGAMEVLNTYISLNEGFIPGTINLDAQDPDCDVNVVKSTIKRPVKKVLKNSFGMGGLAASLILSKVGGDL